MNPRLNEIKNSAVKVQHKWNVVMDSLEKAGFDFSQAMPVGDLSLSIKEANERTKTIFDFLTKDKFVFGFLPTIPAERIGRIQDIINAVDEGINPFYTEAENNQKRWRIESGDPRVCKGEINEKGFDVPNTLARSYSHITEFPLDIIQSFCVLSDWWGMRMAGLDRLESAIKEQAEQIAEGHKNASGDIEKISQAAARVDELNHQLLDAQNHLEKIDEYYDNAQSRESSLDNLEEHAKKLLAVSEKLTAKRQKESEIFHESQEVAIAHTRETKRILDKANEVLAGATTAGLGVAFEEASNEYKEKAFRANVGFFFTIVVMVGLFVSLFTPEFVNAVMAFLSNEQSDTAIYVIPPSTPSWQTILTRGTIGLPLLLLAFHFGRQHAYCFRLYKEYKFKAAVARSLEGFKQQTDKYQQEVAAMAYAAIVEEPSIGMPGEKKKSGRVKQMLDKLFSRMAE